MALKIRQKKQQEPQKVHPQYQPNTGTHWAEQYREDNKASFRRSFVLIIAVMIVIIALLIAAAIHAVLPAESNVSAISASETYTISQMEMEQMKSDAQTFVQGILVYAYCSDHTSAMEGKQAALNLMSYTTKSYADIESLEPVSNSIAKDDFAPVVTTPKLQNTTSSYASSFTFDLDGVAADTSVIDESHPNGTFADKGYHFTLTFNYAKSDDGSGSKWVISNCGITAK